MFPVTATKTDPVYVQYDVLKLTYNGLKSDGRLFYRVMQQKNFLIAVTFGLVHITSKKTDSIFEMDPLDSELRILNWILYQVSSNEIKSLK